jgi:hypothetical protein
MWVDNCGRAEGIGSRFFTVAKSSVVTAQAGDTAGLKARTTPEAR